MSKRTSGTIVDDPAKTAANGESIHFQPLLFHPLVPEGAGDLAEWDHFGSVLLALGFKTADGLCIEGSAVLIGPGLALAAKHVLEPRLTELLAAKIAPILVAVTDHGLQIWKLQEMVVGDTDVVILRMDLSSEFPPNNLFHTAALTTRTPKVGERVQIAGFRVEEVQETEISGQVRLGVGEVTAVYPDGRDRVMLPHPCLEVKCLTVGGMSGGPAFDESGHLLGILSSSIKHKDGPSYVSMVWPVYGLEIPSMWPPGAFALPTTIADVARSGLIGMQRPDAFNVEGDGVFKLLQWE